MNAKELTQRIKETFQTKFEEAADEAAKVVNEIAAEAEAEAQELLDAEEADELEAEEEDAGGPEVVQVTVRDGNTLHYQAGSEGDYEKGDAVDSFLANRVKSLILKGNGGVNTSLYGSSTLYLKVERAGKGKGTLTDGTPVNLPHSLGL